MSEDKRTDRDRDVVVVINHIHPDVPPLLAIAMQVGSRDRDYIDAARQRSYELAVARGHVRR